MPTPGSHTPLQGGPKGSATVTEGKGWGAALLPVSPDFILFLFVTPSATPKEGSIQWVHNKCLPLL